MNRIKKYTGEILLIVGSFIAIHELFSFKSSFYGSRGGVLGLPSLTQSSPDLDPAVYYYYSNESLLLLSLGVALVVLGILIIRNKKYELDKK